jgi:hypothetical protein
LLYGGWSLVPAIAICPFHPGLFLWILRSSWTSSTTVVWVWWPSPMALCCTWRTLGVKLFWGRFDDVQPTGCDNMPEQVSGLKCLIPTPPWKWQNHQVYIYMYIGIIYNYFLVSLSIYLSIYRSINPSRSMYRSSDLLIYRLIHRSIKISINQSINQPIKQSFDPSRSIYLSIDLSIDRSIFVSIYVGWSLRQTDMAPIAPAKKMVRTGALQDPETRPAFFTEME